MWDYNLPALRPENYYTNKLASINRVKNHADSFLCVEEHTNIISRDLNNIQLQ